MNVFRFMCFSPTSLILPFPCLKMVLNDFVLLPPLVSLSVDTHAGTKRLRDSL